MFLKRMAIMAIAMLWSMSTVYAQPEEKKDAQIVDTISSVFVEIQTNQGKILLELDGEKAPNTVGNFIQYIVDKHFDGLIFHRVIPGFMIQGGGYDQDMKLRATRTPIDIESKNGLKNVKGSIAMARSQNPNSATSQFFINTVDNDFLNYPGADGYGYTVFGKVIEGMDVVSKIEQMKTESKMGHQDVPTEAVIIEKVILVEKKEETTKETKQPTQKPVDAPLAEKK